MKTKVRLSKKATESEEKKRKSEAGPAQHALSVRCRAKRAYKGPKSTSATINREPVQGKQEYTPQQNPLS
ncbi:hypothetical protein HKD37_06G016746 [Glycine soja]